MKTFRHAAPVAAIALAFALAGCTSENDARKALASAGYTDVEITGYRPFSCAKDDTFRTGFRANGPTGQPSTGTVCSDFLKGSTIRTD